MTLDEYEQLLPHCVFEGITFITPNKHCAWRVESLETKEPDTMAWIRRMKEGETFFDVGANMGQYSLMAAKQGLIVHAFEPESQNFALMCRNFAINQEWSSRMHAWPLALTSHPHSGADEFHVTSLIAGGSCNSFGDQVDFHLKPKTFAFRQGSYGMTMDAFVGDGWQWPHHIKIDVDGFEHRVLEGALQCLDCATSVLVELNTALPEHQAIIGLMKEKGFHPDLATADKARRTAGAFKGIGNVIFFRDPAHFLSAGA